jgi:hypothetical protein
VPAATDHPLARRTQSGPEPGPARRTQLIFPLDSFPLQESRAPPTDTDLGMGAQPKKVLIIEFATAAPAHRCRRLEGLRRNGHSPIVPVKPTNGYQPETQDPRHPFEPYA